MEPAKSNSQKTPLEFIREFLDHMDVHAVVDEGVIGDSSAFLVRTEDAGLLIGEDGQNLLALTHLLRKVIEKKLPTTPPHFIIDVNDYQRRRFD